MILFFVKQLRDGPRTSSILKQKLLQSSIGPNKANVALDLIHTHIGKTKFGHAVSRAEVTHHLMSFLYLGRPRQSSFFISNVKQLFRSGHIVLKKIIRLK